LESQDMTFEDNVRILREEVLRANSFVRYLLLHYSLPNHLFVVLSISRVSLLNQINFIFCMLVSESFQIT